MDDSNKPTEPVQVVTPWTVSSENGVDYNRLMEEFGAKPIDDAMIDRIEKVTGRKAHKWLRRGIFYSHRFEFLLFILLIILFYFLLCLFCIFFFF